MYLRNSVYIPTYPVCNNIYILCNEESQTLKHCHIFVTFISCHLYTLFAGLVQFFNNYVAFLEWKIYELVQPIHTMMSYVEYRSSVTHT